MLEHRFTWQEMRRYWEAHSVRWAGLDLRTDPEGLGNVCHGGEPLWLNQYYARFQRIVYEELLKRVPAAIEHSRALDVGCGAARWSQLLVKRGFMTVGIDLQPELLEANRRRFPEIEFLRSAVQDFRAAHPFDLISSVTVLQHLPFAEQEHAVKNLRSLAKTGAFAVILENISDQGCQVFANSIPGWQDLFGRNGFRLVGIRRYDYSPFLRTIALARRLATRGRPSKNHLDPNRLVASGRSGVVRFVKNVVTRVAIALDTPIESITVSHNIDLQTVHCGFLFEAV